MIPYKDGRTFPIEDFSAGLRTTGTYFSRVMTSPKVMNARSGKERLLLKRMGFDNDTLKAIGTSPITGMYEYGISSTNRKQLAASGSRIYKQDNFDGVWDVLQTGLTDGAISEFETFTHPSGNVLLQCTHSNDTYKYWDGSTATMTVDTSSGVPAPKYLRVWQNHVWAAGLADRPSRLRYTNVATYNEWQTSSVDNYDDNFQTGDGDYITGLHDLRGNLYVFKRNSIFRVTYLGGTPLISVNRVVDGIGCISNKSICEGKFFFTDDYGVTREREVLIFLTADKAIVAFDGATIFPLSTAITADNFHSTICMKNLNDLALSEAHAVYYVPEDTYILFVGGNQSTTMNYAITINAVTRGIFAYDNMNFASIMTRITETNRQQLFVGNYTGEMYRFWYGSKDVAGTVTPGLKSLIHFEDVDASTTITDYMNRTWTVFGSAQIDTAQFKFGGSSLLLDGVNSYIYTSDSDDFDFSGGVWSASAQIRPNSLASDGTIFSQVTDNNNYWELVLKTTGEVNLKVVAAGVTVVTFTTTSASITTGAWFEVEVVENGSNYYIFVNGTLRGSGSDVDRLANYTNLFEIGRTNAASTNYFNGWIDEVRIIKGFATHTATYTANTAAFDSRSYANVDISMYWETDLIDIKASNVLKKNRNLTIYLKPRSNSSIIISRTSGYESTYRESRTYTITANSNVLGALTLGTQTIGADYGAILCYDVPETTSFLRLRISESSQLESFAIHRIDLGEDVLGIGNSVYSGVTVA